MSPSYLDMPCRPSVGHLYDLSSPKPIIASARRVQNRAFGPNKTIHEDS